MITYDPATHEPCAPEPRLEQVPMCINGFIFWADPEFVPLLEALNEVGLQTYSHCAGHANVNGNYHAWLVLEMPEGMSLEVRHHYVEDRKQIVLKWNRPAPEED